MKILRDNSLKNVLASELIQILSSDKINFDTVECNIKNLQLSRYNIVRHYKKGSIILNTFSESVVILDAQEQQLFKKIKEGKIIKNQTFMCGLFENGILVKNDLDELSLLYSITEQSLKNTPKQLKVAVNTTYKCNARCKYCFEYASKKNHLSMETANDIVDYICRTIKEDEKLTYRWFGGEPLVNPGIIDYIINNVNQRCGKDLVYDGAILTNGTLITNDILEKIAGIWHIREVHFTLDGYKATHNQSKMFVDNIDGYRIVLENIRKLLPIVERVTCRINIDKNNIEEFECIIKDLAPLNDMGNLNIYPAAVRAHNIDCLNSCYDYSEYAVVFDCLYKVMDKYGLLTISHLLPVRKISCCAAKNTNEVVIGIDGKFYKCMQTSTYDQNSIGSCKTGIVDNEEMKKWIAPYWQDECKGCVFLPACQGGCKGHRALNNPFISPCSETKYTISPVVNILAEKYNLI